MELRISNINYRLDEKGTTQSIQTSIAGSENSDYVNATLGIVAADLPSSKETLDDLTRKDIQKIALGKLQTLVSQNSPTSPSK